MRAAYGHSDQPWNGAELLRVVQDAGSGDKAPESVAPPGGLEALHRV